MGDDVTAGIGLEPVGPAEVIRMTMGDDDRMNPLQGDIGLLQSPFHRGVTALFRKAGVYNGDPSFVFKDVHIDVAEPRNRNGQLRP